jgi:type II secretory pathway component PulF
MKVFVYKAKKDNAETVVGEVSAHDAAEAIELVSRMELLPISVEEKSPEAADDAAVKRGQSVRGRDILTFTRQLVSLLRSGVAVLPAIELLSRRTRDARFARVLSDMALNIRNGRTFSSCLVEYPAIFPPLYVAMAGAGEESGKLRELLSEMAEHFRKQQEIALKIRTALIYPAFMAVVGISTVAFILSFVMPRITVLFKDLNTALPLPTLIVMRVSTLVQKGWPVVFVLVFFGIIFWRSFGRVDKVRRVLYSLLDMVPIIRDLSLKIDLERFTRTMGLLLDSGIPILRALEVAIPTVANEALKDELRACQDKVAGGAGFGQVLGESALVPELVAQLIAVGEESGELALSLKDIADSYEQEIGEATKTMTTLLEPALILIVGGVIAFIVFAMLMPIFQMDIFAR